MPSGSTRSSTSSATAQVHELSFYSGAFYRDASGALQPCTPQPQCTADGDGDVCVSDSTVLVCNVAKSGYAIAGTGLVCVEQEGCAESRADVCSNSSGITTKQPCIVAAPGYVLDDGVPDKVVDRQITCLGIGQTPGPGTW